VGAFLGDELVGVAQYADEARLADPSWDTWWFDEVAAARRLVMRSPNGSSRELGAISTPEAHADVLADNRPALRLVRRLDSARPAATGRSSCTSST
jgi:hypothetical protein